MLNCCHVLRLVRLDRAGPNDLNLIFSLRGYDSSASAPNRGQYCASVLRTRGFLIRTRVLMLICDIIGQSMGQSRATRLSVMFSQSVQLQNGNIKVIFATAQLQYKAMEVISF